MTSGGAARFASQPSQQVAQSCIGPARGSKYINNTYFGTYGIHIILLTLDYLEPQGEDC